MESIIRDIIMEHFLATDYFTKKQYRLIRGRSTALQLLRILDDWTFNLDLGTQIDVIYTDFEKPSIRFLTMVCFINCKHLV